MTLTLTLSRSTGTGDQNMPMRIALAVIFCCAMSTMAANLSIVAVKPVQTVHARDLVEWRIAVDRPYSHPFDPDQISVDAAFTDSTGKTISVPAFWDEPPHGEPAFFVRFAPPTAGRWSISVTSNHAPTIIGESFDVLPANSPGFLRRASNDRYFQFENGVGCFLVGLNLCWTHGPAAASWYDRTFATLAANGGNYARVWMARPGVPLEGVDQKLNQYSLANAKFFDDVLAAGEAHGISIMLTLINYRDFIDRDMWGPADWPKHPYNAARGGPATRPVDFFTDPEARRLFKARLRYLVARYSAYRSLAFWELFNEQENLPFAVPTAWNAEMADYLRQIDPAKHLITTSARPPGEVWRLPEMDLTQSHLYGDGTFSDQVGAIARSVKSREPFGKPHLVGEAGIDFHGADTPFDPAGKGTAFHNSLWASLATGNAGTAMYWWWDWYIEPKQLWGEFKPISDFAASIDWAHRDYRPIDIDDVWHDDAKGPAAHLAILPAGGWGDTNHGPIIVPPSGRPRVAPAAYLYGPHHKELSTPLTFDLTMPERCVMRAAVSKVSDMAVVRASIDGRPVRDWLFSVLPGAGNIGHTEVDKTHGQYIADVKDPIELPMPAGHHVVTLQVSGGDWVVLSKIVFTNAVEAKYAHLRAYAVQDAATKDTLLWLWDSRSNWKDDQAGDPSMNAAVKLVVPGVAAGSFDCRWVDTRSGQTLANRTIACDGEKLTLNAPNFSRDIAAHISRR